MCLVCIPFLFPRVLSFACESGIEQIIERVCGETVRHMCFPVASRAIRLLSKLIRAPDDAPEEEELSNFFRNKSWASRGAARACLLYTGPAISYGRRFRPITLTRLTRGIQSANARRGLRLRSLTALRAKSPNNAR